MSAHNHYHKIYCYYRLQTKFAKVIFSQVSVCPQEGVCPIACWDTHPPGPEADIPLGPDTPLGPDIPLGPDTPGTKHPRVQCMLGDTGNKRAVRILRECILVIDGCFSDVFRVFFLRCYFGCLPKSLSPCTHHTLYSVFSCILKDDWLPPHMISNSQLHPIIIVD